MMEMSLAGRQLGTAFARAASRRHTTTRRVTAMLPSGSEHQRAAARLSRLLSSLGPAPQQRLPRMAAAASESAGASAVAAQPSAAAAACSAVPALASGYRLPPKEIADIVDAPPEPLLSFSPNRETVMQLSRPPSNPPISELARPELKLAGGRLEPVLALVCPSPVDARLRGGGRSARARFEAAATRRCVSGSRLRRMPL